MDWKFRYDDGALDCWTPADAEEFLFEWCPRKLAASPADSAEIPRSVAAFVEFLAHAGLLAPGSGRPSDIHRVCERGTNRFVREMGNPANFGMAKNVFAGASPSDGEAHVEAISALLDQLTASPPTRCGSCRPRWTTTRSSREPWGRPPARARRAARRGPGRGGHAAVAGARRAVPAARPTADRKRQSPPRRFLVEDGLHARWGLRRVHGPCEDRSGRADPRRAGTQFQRRPHSAAFSPSVSR
jgi:hypothetical protein